MRRACRLKVDVEAWRVISERRVGPFPYLVKRQWAAGGP